MNQKYWLYSSVGWGMLSITLMGNYLFASGIVNYELLYQSVQLGWDHAMKYEYMTVIKILLIRTMITGGIWFTCRNRQCLFYKVIILVFIGIGIGYEIVLFTWNKGMLGLWYLLLCNTPHSFLYGGAWLFLIENQGKQPKFIPWILFGVGIFFEIYINPLFLGLI